LVDLHAHPGPPDSRYGVDPYREFLRRGATTVLSQGDAGGANWDTYRESIIAPALTRVRMALNLSVRGETGAGFCFNSLDEADVDACVAAVQRGGDLVWGISLNTAKSGVGDTDPRALTERAIEVARRTGKPILYGTHRDADWPLADQIALLRAGDVLTYCFQGQAESIVQGNRVIDGAWEARQRGVIFDIGHGMSSFSFPVAATAIREGFPPDTISADQYRRHVGSVPQHDMPRTISKLIAAGMPPADALAAATLRPAQVLGLADEIGTLAAGACADLAVLRHNTEALPLRDVDGLERPGGCWEPLLVVRGGRLTSP